MAWDVNWTAHIVSVLGVATKALCVAQSDLDKRVEKAPKEQGRGRSAFPTKDERHGTADGRLGRLGTASEHISEDSTTTTVALSD